MDYAKCQQHDDEQEDEREYFEDEPQHFDKKYEDYSDDKPRKMAPFEMELDGQSNDDDDNNNNNNDDDAEEDAVSLLGSDAGGGGGGGAACAGDFYSSNASSNDGSTYSRRSSTGGYDRHDDEITLREMAAVQGRTCCPVYFCALVLLSLLVAAIFVAPTPAKNSNNNNNNHNDTHYRSPSEAAQSSSSSSSSLQQLTCELDITSNTSWSAYLQNINVSDAEYGVRCTQERSPDRCHCKNPLVPDFPHQPLPYAHNWQQGFQKNLDRIRQWEKSQSSIDTENENKNLDVVFLGDSITEHWAGTSLGVPRPDKWSGNVHVFQNLFGNATSMTKSSETNLMGMPLGISGDRCPNLLYRLYNGELPSSSSSSSSTLQPSIWWILIGTNDHLADKCQANQVIAGNIAIVEYLRQQRPNATIVLNSLLPVGRDETLEALAHWRNAYLPINQALECYVQGHEHDANDGKLYFFNATDLFLTSDGQSINHTLLPDGLHPGEEGSWIWGRAIVQKIQEILANSRRDG